MKKLCYENVLKCMKMSRNCDLRSFKNTCLLAFPTVFQISMQITGWSTKKNINLIFFHCGVNIFALQRALGNWNISSRTEACCTGYITELTLLHTWHVSSLTWQFSTFESLGFILKSNLPILCVLINRTLLNLLLVSICSFQTLSNFNLIEFNLTWSPSSHDKGHTLQPWETSCSEMVSM